MNNRIIGHFSSFEDVQHPQVHDHFCFLYDTETEWKSFVAIFVRIGLSQGEKCIYVFDTHTSRQVHEALRSEGIDVAACESSGQLLILHGSRIFGADSESFACDMSTFLVKEATRAMADGYPVVRVTSESDWILRYGLSVPKVSQFESTLDRDIAPNNPCIQICQYDKNRFTSDFINSVLINHKCVVMNNKIYHNTYYTADISDWLNKEGIASNMLLAMIEKDEIKEEARSNRTRALEVLLDESQSAIIAVDSEGLITDANQKAAMILECPPENLLRRSIREFTDQTDQIKDNLKVNPFGIIRNGEVVFRINGRIKILNINVTPVTLEGRRIFYATGQDITRRKHAEQALKDSLNNFREMMQFIDQPIACHEVVFNDKGQIEDFIVTAVNKAFEKLSGFPLHQTIGRRASDLFGKSECLILKEYTLTALNGQPIESEATLSISNHTGKVSLFAFPPNLTVVLWSDKPVV